MPFTAGPPSGSDCTDGVSSPGAAAALAAAAVRVVTVSEAPDLTRTAALAAAAVRAGRTSTTAPAAARGPWDSGTGASN